MELQLTELAQKLSDIVSQNGQNYEDRDEDIDELATCMGSEEFSYALFE